MNHTHSALIHTVIKQVLPNLNIKVQSFCVYIFPACRVCGYHGEDQVVEGRGGQQEQQDGEEEGPDEELKDRHSESTHTHQVTKLPSSYLVQVVAARVNSLPQNVPLPASEESPERAETVELHTVEPRERNILLCNRREKEEGRR